MYKRFYFRIMRSVIARTISADRNRLLFLMFFLVYLIIAAGLTRALVNVIIRIVK